MGLSEVKQLAQNFTDIAIWHARFQLKITTNPRHAATQLASQLAKLPQKMNWTVNFAICTWQSRHLEEMVRGGNTNLRSPTYRIFGRIDCF
jgi:hypothetical protein